MDEGQQREERGGAGHVVLVLRVRLAAVALLLAAALEAQRQPTQTLRRVAEISGDSLDHTMFCILD